MAPKRRQSNANKDGNDSPYSKRPRRSGNQSDAQTIYDLIKEYEDKNGNVVSESFMRLPSKRHHSAYYEMITDPIDLTKIGQKVKQEEYRDIEALTTDIQLLTENAKLFYEENSKEYGNACSLMEGYLEIKSKFLGEGKSSEPNKPKSTKKESEINIDDMKELFENLVSETDYDGRVIADMFMQLPDPSNVQYFEVIKEPIDFFTIGEKLEEGLYPSVAEFKKDVMQLVKNARTFNEPHSQIYQDAISIKNMLRDKIDELEKSKRGETTGKSSGRLKSRKSFGTARVSGRLQEKFLTKQESVEVKYDIHDASILHPSEDDYQALLYNEIVNYRNNLGHTISDPFVRLPNKRFYPVYYDDIENPISLKIIRRKIQSKKYENCGEMAADFNLLFSNAKEFNVSSSQIHKDAVTLQNFLDSKLSYFSTKEDEDMEEVSGSEEEEEQEAVTKVNEEKAEDTANTDTTNTDEKIQEKEDTTEKEEKGDEEEVVQKKKRKRRRKSTKESLQGRLQLLYNTLMEAEDESGREMITLFMEKPSRKDYPDYYKLILEPIDMKMIDRKIRQDKYFSVDDMLEDFDLMFNNARHYNEPGSEVYSDADALEKLLLEKNKELGPLPVNDGSPEKVPRFKMSIGTALEEKMSRLFVAVRDYTDPTHRKICEIFMHLPSKQVLPDYYKVIKKPLDMDRIQTRMQGGHSQYAKLEEMLADMLLMFENACAYNEPGSLIYKDALLLQKYAVDKFYEIEPVPPILSPKDLVQEMLISLFMSVMGHQDESGRCYSESFTSSSDSGSKKGKSAVPQTAEEKSNGNKLQTGSSDKKLTLDVIKKNLHNRRYRRLDVFQDHVFEVFEEARKNNRTDSEIYEDAVELQRFFIKIRDELSKNGETLMSPALIVSSKRFELEVEAEKKEKQPGESREDEQAIEEGKDMKSQMSMSSPSNEMDFEGTKYSHGDFVYIENPENPSTPHIVNIEKLYTDETGQRMLYGVWLYRPEATFHMASKKFFVKEVFKSDYYNAVSVSLIQGKCFVMLSKDYFKLKPVGFKEEDVYVAESRYSSRVKSFKRLKLTQWPHSSIELVPRESPLPVIRISSCYSDQKPEEPSSIDKMRTMLMHDIEDSWPTDVIEVERKGIEAEGPAFGEAKHYIQYYVGDMWVKLGDCVYIRQPDTDKPKIARVERLWTDISGKVWFHGAWFIRPEDAKHEPTRMFYKNELFISCAEDTFVFDNVIGKCIVLYVRDYFACRPTEMPEKDVYVFESKYVAGENVIKKIKGKRYTPTYKVVDDEYYYYKRALSVQNFVSPFLLKACEEEIKHRENEAISIKTKPEIEEVPTPPPPVNKHPSPAPPQPQMYPQSAPMPYPPQPLPMMPGQPYRHYPQMVQQFPGSPAQMPHPSVPPQVYVQQQQVYPPNVARYPSPHPGMPMQQFQNPPHVYPPSPHGTQPPQVTTPTSGMQSPEGSRPSSARPEAAPTPPTTKKKGKVGHSTGYILFASYYHPKVRAENPDMPFGEISKIVGEEWRHLEDEKKREYEEKAKEHTAKLEAEGRLLPKKRKKKKEVEEPTPPPPPAQHQGMATPQQMVPHPPGQYPPTPGQPQMHPQMMPPGGVPQQYPMATYAQTPTGHPYPQQQVVATPPQAPPPPTVAQKHRMKRGPLFLKPPPKAQRVMHSEAYLRYIEGLESGSKTVSNWEKTIKVKESDVNLSKDDQLKLPVHWLGNGQGRFESVSSALWSLRDMMLKDALAIKDHFD